MNPSQSRGRFQNRAEAGWHMINLEPLSIKDVGPGVETGCLSGLSLPIYLFVCLCVSVSVPPYI